MDNQTKTIDMAVNHSSSRSCDTFKGQSSMELLITLGVVLAFTIPVLFLLLSVMSVGYEDTTKAQADAASRSLADTINLIYAQGDGAKKTVLINVPPSTEEVYVQSNPNGGGEVVIRIKTSEGSFEAVSPVFARINGKQDVGERSGLFAILVYNNDGEVELIEPTNAR